MAHRLQTDVLIVGGGPAGTSTALSLLTYSDLDVTIIEQSGLNGIRVGEQVNPSIFDLLDYLKISREDFENGSFISGYSHNAAWGSDRISTRESIFSTQGESLQLNREHFDLHLMQEAAHRGARIFPKTRCLDYRQLDNGHWEIDLMHHSKGEFTIETRFLVDATGRQCHVSRKLGIGSQKFDDLLAVGAFLRLPEGQSIRQDVLIETVEDGWWYCAALPDQLISLTFFTDADIVKQKQLHKPENWNAHLAQTAFMKRKVQGAYAEDGTWVKNAFSQLTDCTLRNHFITVGDAACSFDPIASMGIGFAISSACHAARAIMDVANGHTETISAYQQGVQHIFNGYLGTKSHFYRKEQRWNQSLFWKRRLEDFRTLGH